MSSRREFIAAACALAAGAGCLGRGGSSGVQTFRTGFLDANQTLEPKLTVVGRHGALPTLALSDFQVANSVTVTTDYVSSDDALLLRLSAGGYGSFDVVQVGSRALATMVALNQVEPLASSLVPNRSALHAPFDDSPVDSGLKHSAPASYDLVGIAVSANAPVTPTSWAQLFALAERYPGRVVVPNRPNDVIGAVLVSLGHAWDTDSTGDLDDASQRLGTLVPLLRIEGHRPPAPPAGHRRSPFASLARGADYRRAKAGVRFVVPSEGTALDVRSYCIPIYAPHPVSAHAWINDWLQPSVEAGAARELRLPVPLAQARPLMHPGLVLNQAICPPLGALANSIQPSYSVAGTDRRAQIWSELVL